MPKKSKDVVLNHRHSEENDDAEFFADERESKQSSASNNAAKENSERHRRSRKRRHSDTHDDVSKKLCKDSELPSDLCDAPGRNELDTTFQAEQYIPHDSIGLMYELHLSVLSLLRTYIYRDKYPSLRLAFGDFQIDRFSHIVLRYGNKSVHVQIEHVDKYGNNDIDYASLFAKRRRSSLSSNFNSFVKYLISESDSSLSNVKYLILYTNSGLELTEEKKLKGKLSKNFYPFKFDKINIEKCEVVKDFLFPNNAVRGSGFYEFSREEATREELLNRLELSLTMQKLMKEKEIPPEFGRKMKEAFLDKLVFAVNQLSREELKSIVKRDIERNRELQDDYTALQQKVLCALVAPKKRRKLEDYVSGITYELNLLISLLHTMFCHRNMYSVKVKGKNHDASSNDIVINYRNRVTYIKNCAARGNIGYSQLFPSKHQTKRNAFSINECFALFFRELKTDVRYFIIYTNVGLGITEQNELKKRRSADFHPLKFENVDIRKKKYKILRDCAFINVNGLYQFAQDESTWEKLLSVLKLPPPSEEERVEIFSDENEKQIKEKFLGTLIFAVNQTDETALNVNIRVEMTKYDESYEVPYNFEELTEIAIRCLESHRFSIITREVMHNILKEIKENGSSHQELRNRDNEKIKFAKAVTSSREGTPSFNRFLNFLTQGVGKSYFEILKINGMNVTSVSSILGHAGNQAIRAFTDLYHVWFDAKGNKTQYSKILGQEVNLTTVSSILHFTGADAAGAFKDLYYFWFDTEGNKTRYLKTLEEQRISLCHVSSIVHGAGSHAPESIKDLYDLWFDREGKKTQYLKTLENEGINLSNVSSILNQAGSNSAKAFKNLYDLWFDSTGKRTQYLKNLEKERINISTISSILHGTGCHAPETFKDLYDLWFDAEGNKTRYLKAFEGSKINLRHVSSILAGSRFHAAKTFKSLYDMWFDEKGNKTEYLQTLEGAGINLTNMSCILSAVGFNATRAFKNLYDLWFDAEGNKTKYLNNLEKEGINLRTVSGILHGAGSHSPETFRDLYDLWFDAAGNKSQYLETLEKGGINVSHMCILLGGAGSNATKAFKELYSLWFDSSGNKTQLLKALEREKVKLPNICTILRGTGPNAVKSLKGLCDLWFDAEGNKTQHLETLEKEGVLLSNMSSILGGARTEACKAFKNLYAVWFDEEGNKTRYLENLEKEGIALTVASRILHGAGSNAAKAFKDLHKSWFHKNGDKRSFFMHFFEEKHGKCFTIGNITDILRSSGAGAKDAFEKLHNVLFNDDGSATELLRDFYKADFEPINLSRILYGKRIDASVSIEKFHSAYFHGGRRKPKVLGDFDSRDLNSEDECSISSEAANNEQLFYYFCSTKKSKDYLYHLLQDFTLKNLCKILQQARADIPSALREFHHVCFDKRGKRKQILNDFYGVGFTSRNLSRILYMTGNNASAILKNFHQSCFGERHYLSHFVAAEKLFTPKNISRILSKIGDEICPVFEELHNLCFHKSGKKRKYLKNLIKNKSSREIIDLLYEQVRIAPAPSLDGASLS